VLWRSCHFTKSDNQLLAEADAIDAAYNAIQVLVSAAIIGRP